MSWALLDFPEVGIVYDLLVEPGNSANVYAGTSRYGFYYSTDGGDTWQSANSGLPDTSWVSRILLSSAQVYIAVSGGGEGAVYESSRDSFQWEKLGAAGFEPVIYTANLSLKKNCVLAGAKGVYVFCYEKSLKRQVNLGSIECLLHSSQK